MKKSFDHVSLLFLWLIVGSTFCSDVKSHVKAYWQLLRMCGARNSNPGVLWLFAVLQRDSVPLHTHTGTVARSSKRCDPVKNAAWQSKQKRWCSVGSRALVSRPEGPVLPGLCRVTGIKSVPCCALPVPPHN